MMNGKQLKNSILQWAIQGKLVPQDPNDEPASVLLERIRKEKARLVKEKKIKKDKNESVIFRGDDKSYYEKFADGTVKCIDEEIPFEIPQGWEWERWGNLAFSIQYGYNAPAETAGNARMVRISDIQDNKVLWDTVPYCHITENEIETYQLRKNDILFARTGGTVGKSYIVSHVPYQAIYAGYLIRTRYSDSLCPMFLKHFMDSQLYWEQLRNGTIATAQPNCNGKTLSRMILPIPPIDEQNRIVDKLDEVLPIIVRYSKYQDELNLLNTEIKSLLRKSILQEAIQGKLIPQNIEDDDANMLIQRLNEEKNKLSKRGRLKKNNFSTSYIYRGDDNRYYEQINGQITDINDEIPFEIPDTWNWIRLSNLVCLISGTSYDKADIKKQGIRILRGGNIVNEKIRLNDDDVFVSNEYFDSEKQIHKDDIVIVGSTGSYTAIGRPAFCQKEMSNVQIGAFLKIIRPYSSLYSQWLSVYFKTPYYRESISNSVKGTSINNVKASFLLNMLVPFPPLSKQQILFDIVQTAQQLLQK